MLAGTLCNVDLTLSKLMSFTLFIHTCHMYYYMVNSSSNFNMKKTCCIFKNISLKSQLIDAVVSMCQESNSVE